MVGSSDAAFDRERGRPAISLASNAHAKNGQQSGLLVQDIIQYCIVLYCIVLYCVALYSIVLY